MTGPAGHSLRLHGLTKHYGAHAAISDVNLSVEQGEFLTLLGPSGSGKTTVLMSIAGFVEPTRGSVLLDGRDITALPPERRDFGLVFQGYALFPHMTVAENVAFSLRVRRLPRIEITARVNAALDLVQLAGFAGRKPSQLSGGQQQRVALARALVFDPSLLLLDEPLGALDKKLRAELQEELKALHRRIGRTFISVTHDQEEALSMSDRIAILRDGRLVQQGTPAALYDTPRSRFVADFLGKSNFLAGAVREFRPGGFAYTINGARFVQATAVDAPRPPLGSEVLLSLRPEKLAVLAPGAAGDNVVDGTIASVSYLGAAFEIVAECAVGRLRAAVPAWRFGLPATGAAVRLGWTADAAVSVEAD